MNNTNDTEISLKKFKLNEEGSFSITRPHESQQIINCMEKFINGKISLSKMIITDATACMGGDLVQFSKYFRIINGIEIDPLNFKLLVENCKIFNCLNINLFNQNYLDIFDKLRQDIIYLDCPWTGPDYKYKETIHLKLCDLHLWELINKIRDSKLANYIFIKAPSNVCLDNIDYDTLNIIYNKSKKPSFKLICILVS